MNQVVRKTAENYLEEALKRNEEAVGHCKHLIWFHMQASKSFSHNPRQAQKYNLMKVDQYKESLSYFEDEVENIKRLLNRN